MTEKAILFDTTKCIACRACQVACKQWWELPAVATTNRGTYENPPNLSAETWNKIMFREVAQDGSVKWLFTRQACMHCTEAACVQVCPTYARSYNALGYVHTDQERCIGCGRCMDACPFKVPKIGKANLSPRIPVTLSAPRPVAYKCKFCEDRVEDGLTPACVQTCPPGALQFGERAELIEQGKARVEAIKAAYPNASLYGEKELGGLHVMYVLTDAPSVHGLPETPQLGTYTKFDEKSFPGWYNQAIADGKLAAFPEGAKHEWYLQPLSVPTAETPETPTTAKPAVDWKAPVLWSLLGLGVIGGVWWMVRRRMTRQTEKPKT